MEQEPNIHARIEAAVGDQVKSERHNLEWAYDKIKKILHDLPLHSHMSCAQMIALDADHRQGSMKLAMMQQQQVEIEKQQKVQMQQAKDARAQALEDKRQRLALVAEHEKLDEQGVPV